MGTRPRFFLEPFKSMSSNSTPILANSRPPRGLGLGELSANQRVMPRREANSNLAVIGLQFRLIPGSFGGRARSAVGGEADMRALIESVVEHASLAWLESIGWP